MKETTITNDNIHTETAPRTSTSDSPNSIPTLENAMYHGHLSLSSEGRQSHPLPLDLPDIPDQRQWPTTTGGSNNYQQRHRHLYDVLCQAMRVAEEMDEPTVAEAGSSVSTTVNPLDSRLCQPKQ